MVPSNHWQGETRFVDLAIREIESKALMYCLSFSAAQKREARYEC